jgi:hypothetical protein
MATLKDLLPQIPQDELAILRDLNQQLDESNLTEATAKEAAQAVKTIIQNWKTWSKATVAAMLLVPNIANALETYAPDTLNDIRTEISAETPSVAAPSVSIPGEVKTLNFGENFNSGKTSLTSKESLVANIDDIKSWTKGKNLNNYLSFKEKADLPDERGTESYDVTLKQISPDWLYKQVFSEVMTGAYPTSNTECGLFSIKQSRPLKISDIFEGNTWQHVFATVIKKHFFNLAKKDKDFDLTMVSDTHLNVTQSSSLFTFCLSQKGIELFGFLPHVVRAFDGVTIEWHSLNNALTPYAQEQIKKLTVIQ